VLAIVVTLSRALQTALGVLPFSKGAGVVDCIYNIKFVERCKYLRRLLHTYLTFDEVGIATLINLSRNDIIYGEYHG
jgi:hypothetical protein